MTVIEKDADLAASTVNPFDWNQNGWETCAANAWDVVIYTFNSGAAYSIDGGNTFHLIDANGLCARYGKSLAGDQVVIYIPSINQFAWVILTRDQNIVLAMASPDEIRQTEGTAWVTWLIPPANFGDGKSLFDRPSISFGVRFFYIATNLGGNSIAVRISIAELAARGWIGFTYFTATDGVFWLKTAQNTGDTGYFAALTYVKQEDGKQFISNIRVFQWPDDSNTIPWFDVPISSVPTDGWVVRTPSGDWPANQKGNLQVLGLAFTEGDLWATWSGNRTVPDPPPGVPTLSFPYPHIGIAVVNVFNERLKAQRYIWSSDCAFLYPDLTINIHGDVGLSYCWGGAAYDPQFGVGTMAGNYDLSPLISITGGPSSSAGGDYISVRLSYPDEGSFVAAGFNQVPPQPINHAHFVVFSP